MTTLSKLFITQQNQNENQNEFCTLMYKINIRRSSKNETYSEILNSPSCEDTLTFKSIVKITLSGYT